MYSLSNIIIQASINAFGTDIVAAYTAYGKLDGLYWMMINAFGVSITTFVGQNFGAGKYDRMRRRRARVSADDLRRHGADERLFPAAGRAALPPVHR